MEQGRKGMVMVPVPEELVTDVYRFIVEETERRRKGEVVEETERMREGEIGQNVQPPGLGRYPWSEEDLAQLLENGRRSVKLILPYLAERPGEWVDGQELAELVYGQSGRMQQLGGALGSFTKIVRRYYKHENWPFEARHDDEERAWKYMMDAETAEKVRRLVAD